MQDKETNAKKKGIFSTVGGWFKRMFMGASKEVDVLAVEEIVSPGRAIVKNFFRRKLATGALVVLILMFLLVFIGPIFLPIDLGYTATSQANTPPGITMMSVPGGMKDQVKSISSYSTFSVGVSKDGELFVWGNGMLGVTKISIKDIPEELEHKKVAFAAAGKDHAIAITEDGQIYGWGVRDNGQYGDTSSMSEVEYMAPVLLKDAIPEGTVNVDEVASLVCGNQVSAIVMKDGTLKIWGNYRTGATNLKSIRAQKNVEKLAFTNSCALILQKDGTILCRGEGSSTYLNIEKGGELYELNELIGERLVVDIATTNTSLAILLEDGEIIVSGNALQGEADPPALSGEKYVSIAGGATHYSAVTDQGNVYSWGSNEFGQSTVPAKVSGAAHVYTGPYQNYAVDAEGNLIGTWGLRGYLFGTDHMGRDVLARVINGGKMTMTIGAVAVIVSSIIGIIIGCISGYFGGWVDMILMRITEIFSSIPFLPFALILSAVLRTRSVPENTRIFMIMVILGLLSWTGLARLVRAQVLSEREKEFVLAAKAMGVRERKIAFKHILPNIISVILVTMTLDFAGCMLTESSLSYLGFGVQLPRPTWGNMLDGCNNSLVIQNFWWRWFFPALFLGIATICINVIGDTLRDVMDPKSSSER